MKRVTLALLCFCLGAMAGPHTKYVNPLIGTGPVKNSLSGNCYPGATVPLGMVQLSPDTRDSPDWNVASGYNYNDHNIYGFSHTHLSGTGVGDLFDVMLMPSSDSTLDKPVSSFSHTNESAAPGSYSVRLDKGNILVRLAATPHVGVHQYQFSPGQRQRIWIDMDHSVLKSSFGLKIIQSQLRVVSPTVIEGFRIITGWAQLRRVYFHMELSRPIKSYQMVKHGRAVGGGVAQGSDLRMAIDLDPDSGQTVMCKVALSAVSAENAMGNMQTEAKSWDMNHYVLSADRQWENILNKIDVDGTEEQKIIFYTALYHAYIQPNEISDCNGQYLATDFSTQQLPPGQKYYSTFSLWDTFRAVHPLYNLLTPQYNADFCTSMLLHAKRYGYLPMWDLWGQDNYCMIANPAIPVIVDAALKGIIDKKEALQAVIVSAETSHNGSNFEAWKKYGYMPEDIQSQSVSFTMEECYEDWCVARLAEVLGDGKTREQFYHRAKFYRQIYNPKTRFFQGRDSKGDFIYPFDPYIYGGNGGSPYTEGNAWQWYWFIPQDVTDLIRISGGKKAFEKKLDDFFTDTVRHGSINSNASGFIGQYAHGNEPSQHIPYLYDYIGQPGKTQQRVHEILTTLYNTSSAGYAGNDDCGQMSAWFIFSSMGFYPVNPVSGQYAIGTPLFSRATIHLPNGRDFTIKANRQNADDYYVKSVRLNGKKLAQANFLEYKDITQGGELVFNLSK